MTHPGPGSSPESIAARRAAFVERTAIYRRAGYDRQAAAAEVAALAPATDGPVLEVGTGKGQLAIALARRGFAVTSVDVDAAEQELTALLAAEAGVAPRLTLRLADAAALPFADGVFAGAAMMDVLHHLDDPWPALREMARVVRPGGWLLLADFDEAGFALVAEVHRGEGRVHPRSAASVDGARTALARVGFALVRRLHARLHEAVLLVGPSEAWR